MKRTIGFAAALAVVVVAGCEKDPTDVDVPDPSQAATVTLVLDPAVDATRAVLLRGGFEPGRQADGTVRAADDPTLALFGNRLVPDLAEGSGDPSLDRYVWDQTVGLPAEDVATLVRFPTVVDLPMLPDLALGLREEVRPSTRWWEAGTDLILVSRPHGDADAATSAHWTVEVSRQAPDGTTTTLVTLLGEQNFPDSLRILGTLLGRPPVGDSLVAIGRYTRSFGPTAPDSSWSGVVEVRERLRWSRIVR